MTETIYLQSPASLAQIAAALKNTQASHLLVVLPRGHGRFLTDPVDIGRLQHMAALHGVKVGIVSPNPSARRKLREAGVPTYRTERGGTRRIVRRTPFWRKPAPRFAGAPTRIVSAEKKLASKRLATLPRWRSWLRRYYAIVLLSITLTLVGVAGFYLLPSVHITLYPQLDPLVVPSEIVADPRIDPIDAEGEVVPAELLVTVEKWRSTVATTGISPVPSSAARGTVLFVNRSPQAVVIPAGTRLSTSDDTRLAFQTLTRAEVDGVIGARVEVDVVALALGSVGNVPPNRINRIEGALSTQLSVNNLAALSGGSERQAPSVTEADKARLREQVLTQLTALAAQTMATELSDRQFLARESLRVVAIYAETYSHTVGNETPELTLEIRAEVHGTAVDETLTDIYAIERIEAAVSAGERLLPESVVIEVGEVLGTDEFGRVRLAVTTRGVTARELPVTDALARVRGQETPLALAYINDVLPLRAYPEAEVWPSWFGRFPYVTARMVADIDTDFSDMSVSANR